MKLRSIIFLSIATAATAASALNGANTFARLAVTSRFDDSIIAIPFAGCGETDPEIYVTNLVMTVNLDAGDTLMYKDGSTWYAWEIKNGAWSKMDSVTPEGTTVTPAADSVALACGKAVWLSRKTPANKVYLYGQVNRTKPAGNVALPAGTLAAPSYTVVGNPVENADLDLYLWKGKSFMTEGDMVIVPAVKDQQGKGSGQKTYRYDGTDWTVVTTTETQVTNPFTKQVTVRKTVSYTAISGAGTETISAGCGFLYGCVASGKTLVWD